MATIIGTANSETINGTGGNDVLSGGGGNDILTGGDGYDLLEGEGGNDSLDGGAGVDILALGGARSDYLFEEVTPAAQGVAGVYRVTDLSADGADGVDVFTDIEIIRFRTGGEISLADALDRAPTNIVLGRGPGSNPSVAEGAGRGTIVTTLTGIDPDPGDLFVFTLADDAGGRFSIEGDKLIVARDAAFDFAEADTHDIVVRVTDAAGNSFDKPATVTVGAVESVFTLFAADLPPRSFDVRLWDQADGSIIVTWVTQNEDFSQTMYARKSNGDGSPFDPDDQTPDVALVPMTPTGAVLLGVDRHGNAVFMDEGNDSASANDTLIWIDTATGGELKRTIIAEGFVDNGSDISEFDGNVFVRTTVVANVSDLTEFYAFNDGVVLHIDKHAVRSGGGTIRSTPQGTANPLFVQVASTSSTTQGFFTVESVGSSMRASLPTTTDASTLLDIRSGSSLNAIQTRVQQGVFGIGSFGSDFVNSVDTNEAGEALLAIALVSLSNTSIQAPGRSLTQHITLSATVKLVGSIGERVLATVSDTNAFFVPDVEILDHDTFAYAVTRTDPLTFAQSHEIVFVDGTPETVVTVALPAQSFGPKVTQLGDDQYLVEYLLSSGTLITVAQVYDSTGHALGPAFRFSNIAQLIARGDGTIVGLEQVVFSDQAPTAVEGAVKRPEGVVVTPVAGAFVDLGNDGDLDFTGTVVIGHAGGEQASLRLEDGQFDLTATTLTVTNATVFANIGADTGSPMFRGSFKIDLATGKASDLVTLALPADQTPLTLAGLALSYKGLTIGADGASFGAAFTLPGLLFEGGPTFTLDTPNALLINASGPGLAGFEIELKDGETEYSLGYFNLFKASAKNLVVRYDGFARELAISGEAEVKSDIIDGLAALKGGEGVALKFTDLKIKDGKIDFAGELSAKEWKLTEKLSLENIKVAVVIDDNDVRSVGGAFGLKLPFAQLKGLSFAGNFLLAPSGEERLFLDSLELAAKTNIKLPRNFYLDSISGKLAGLAPAAAEPTPTPTSFTGAVGIGWGEEFTFPAIEPLGIEEQKDIRLVNVTLSATTDFSTFITGTGIVNLISDKVGKHSGAVTWNYDTDVVTVNGAFDYFGGIVTGQASLTLSGAGVTTSATATIAIPDKPFFGPLRGLTLSGNMLTQLLDDGKSNNDFHVVWGTVTLALNQNVTITQVVGFRVDLNTGDPSLILSANDLPKTNSFDVGGTEDYLMIAATWDVAAAGYVTTRVRNPEGNFIQEADYAANEITIVDLYTGSTKKTVIIDDPRAGNWDLQVIDPTGLGAVHYKGYSPNPSAEVTVGAVSLAAGALTGQVTATLTGADPGTIVTFFADSDATGFDGQALGSPTVSGNGSLTFTFDATLLAAGSYHLYAVAIDPTGAPAMDYADAAITVAHRATDIALDGASVADNAAPGTRVGAPTATGPDRSETYVFSLVNDAGGRFALVDGQLVVGTGAPLDQRAAGSHVVTIRATSSHGLIHDETFTVAVAQGDPTRFVQGGSVRAEVLLGGDSSDIFFNVVAGDAVIGGEGSDLLYLNGNRADFELVLDPTGALAGPVHAFVAPPGVDPALLPTNFDPSPPYLLIRDLRGGAGFLISSSIEQLQFRDLRLDLADIAPNLGMDTSAVAENARVSIAVLANDSDPDDILAVATVAGQAIVAGQTITLGSGATVKLEANGTLTYDPNGRFNGLTDAGSGAVNVSALDSFTYALASGGVGTVNVTVNGIASADDVLRGDAGANAIHGTGGGDLFRLEQGGDDVADGGDGNDGFYFGAAFTAEDRVDGGAGDNDQIGLEGDYAGGNALLLGPDTVAGIEAIVVLPGFSYDITAIDANVAADAVLKIQATRLVAGESLSFDGSAQRDGSFIVYGGQGDDRMTGGDGDDGFWFGPGGFDASDLINGGPGANDQLALDGDYTIAMGGNVTNVEVLVLLPGPAGIPNHFNVTTGEAFVLAGQVMTIFGLQVATGIAFDGSHEHDGAFKYYGGAGNDLFAGSSGDDWIFGGGGGDALNGGAGADTFFYDAAGQSASLGFDRITGFDDGADRIDLPFAVTGFATAASGTLASAAFDADLATAFATLAGHQAGMFTATGGDMNGRAFLVIDADGATGYQAGSDYVIEIVTPVTPVDNPALFI